MATEGSATLPTANAPQTTISMASNVVPIVPVPPSTTADKSRAAMAVRVARSYGRWQRGVRHAQGRLGEDSRGQGREPRTVTKHSLKDAPPPVNPMSSLVLAHYGERS